MLDVCVLDNYVVIVLNIIIIIIIGDRG